MTARVSSLPVTSQRFFTAGGHLIGWLVDLQRRKADRAIVRFSSMHHDSYRAEFGLELERRLLGQ